MSNSISFVFFFGVLLFFSKDSFGGISPGRWVMGIMVRDKAEPKVVPVFHRLFLRNLFIIIWPVELVVSVISGNKQRLGDKYLHTVVLNNPEKSERLRRVSVLIGVIAIFIFLLFVFGATALKNSDAYKMAIIEIERNQDVKKETGGIKGYGTFPSGNISITNGRGEAQLEIKVLGVKNDLKIATYLEKEPDSTWKVISVQKY